MKSIDSEILELLRCPVTGSRLQYAQTEIVDRINQTSEAGHLVDRSGQPIDFQIDAALVNADHSLAMPIRAGVVSMAPGRSIVVDRINDSKVEPH